MTIPAYPHPDEFLGPHLLMAMLAKKLRLHRREAGVSLNTLSQRTAVPERLIEVYELGCTPIPVHTLWILCHGIGISPMVIFQPEMDIAEFLPARCRGPSA